VSLRDAVKRVPVDRDAFVREGHTMEAKLGSNLAAESLADSGWKFEGDVMIGAYFYPSWLKMCVPKSILD